MDKQDVLAERFEAVDRVRLRAVAYRPTWSSAGKVRDSTPNPA
jgi:hypothetical protein